MMVVVQTRHLQKQHGPFQLFYLEEVKKCPLRLWRFWGILEKNRTMKKLSCAIFRDKNTPRHNHDYNNYLK